MFEKIDVWYINASTGCTCCSYENFQQGFFKSEEEALAIVEPWRKGIDNPLGSQYAHYGRYSIVKTEAEILPDGRMIIDGEVHEKDFNGRF